MDLENEYVYNWFTKEKYMWKYSAQKKEFQLYRIVSDIFYGIAVAMTVLVGYGMIGELLKTGINADILFLLVVCFGMTFVVPMTVGFGVMSSGINRCASPFCEQKHESLKLYEDGVEFYFHGGADIAASHERVYRIAREDINRVDYDEMDHIIIIGGKGEIVRRVEYAPGESSYAPDCHRSFDEGASFMIMDAFKKGNREEILKSLREMADWQEEEHEKLTAEEENREAAIRKAAVQQKRLEKEIGKYVTGIVVENEVAGAIMIAGFAGMVFAMLTGFITSTTMNESSATTSLLICGLATFAGAAGPIRTLVLSKSGKWERITREIGTIEDIPQEEVAQAIQYQAMGNLIEKVTGKDASIFSAIAQGKVTVHFIAAIIQANTMARKLADAVGKKIPKMFLKCLLTAFIVFAALSVSSGVKASENYRDGLNMRVATVKALNEAFPECAVDPKSEEVREQIGGLDYCFDNKKSIRIYMDKQGNVTEIEYFYNDTKDKNEMFHYVNDVNAKLNLSGAVSKELLKPIPQSLLNEFHPQKEGAYANVVKGNVSYDIMYQIDESYDNSPDIDSLLYDAKLKD